MPEIGLTPVVGFDGAPTMELKYDGYWPPTLIEKNRSNAYLTSLEVTSRFTGGLNFTPFLMWTVIVLRSCGISGVLSSKSGTGSLAFFGFKLYSVLLVGYTS